MSIFRLNKYQEFVLLPNGFVDVKKSCLITGKAIVIKNGKIVALIDKNEINPNEHNVISLPKSTILPGFVDCHVHFALDGKSFQESVERWEKSDLIFEKVIEELNATLKSGVVAVRDGSDIKGLGLKAKKFSREYGIGPFVFATGFALRKDGYYGTFLGEGIKNFEEVAQKIKKLKKLGVDGIKVLGSGIASFNTYKKVGSVQFSLVELKKIVTLAHELGLSVMVHATSDEAVRLSVQAGVDSVEHGYFVSDSTLEMMAKKGTYWIPTIVTLYNQLLEPRRFYYTPEQIEVITKTYEHLFSKVKKAKSLGVNMGIGTDAGTAAVPHGKAFFGEMAAYKRAGFSNSEILKMATLKGARLLKIDDKIGSIEPGKLPYLIGVKGNPLKDIKVLEKPLEVFYL